MNQRLTIFKLKLIISLFLFHDDDSKVRQPEDLIIISLLIRLKYSCQLLVFLCFLINNIITSFYLSYTIGFV